MKCSICGSNRAIIFQRHSGRALCWQCFVDDLVQRVKREIELYNLVRPDDRVLLAVSGGKDSLVLMELMARIISPSRLQAVTVVEGVPGYNRRDEIELCRTVAKSLGVDYAVVALKDVIGYSVSELLDLYQKSEAVEKVSPCTICGVARRRALNLYARDHGFTKVATAHTLDDEAHTYIANFLRGDLMRLVQSHPKSAVHSPKIVKRIKPLRKIYDYEIAIYAYKKGYPLQSKECPLITSTPSLRSRIRDRVIELEWLSPGTFLRIVEWLDRVIEPLVDKLNASRIELPYCEICGEPTSPGRRICRFCELLQKLRAI